MRRLVVLTLLVLASVVLPVRPASAQNDVVIDVQNVPPGVPVEIFMSGARADRTIAGESSATIASSFMSEGKSADVVIDRCKDMVSVSVVEDGRLLPPDQDGCDRTIVENWAWGGGRRLVIDARRGVVVPNSGPTAVNSAATPASASGATTIAARPEVQAAAQAVLDALRTEPSTGAATQATTAALAVLANTPDAGLQAWMMSFADRYAQLTRQGASDSTLGAMGDLLNTILPLHNRWRNSNAGAVDGPAPAPGTREFHIDLSGAAARDFSLDLSARWNEFRDARSATDAVPQISLTGRYGSSAWPIGGERQWFYSPRDEAVYGYPLTRSAGNRPVIFAGPRTGHVFDLQEVRTAFPPPSRLPTLIGPVPDQIIENVMPLMRDILTRFIVRRTSSERPPATAPFGLAGVYQSGQGQVSVATPRGRESFGALDPGVRPRQLLWARSVVEMIRQTFTLRMKPAASSASGMRVIARPDGRREFWIDPMRPNRARSSAGQAQATAEPPRPSVKVFVTSLGRSTGEDAQQAIFINDGNVPVRVLEDEPFATEPLEGVSERAFAQELEKYKDRPRVTMNLTSYCLNYEKAAPMKGRIYRIAPTTAQDALGPVRRILQATERVRDRGELHPDGDPNLYFHSIRQWAIWTVEQRFTERTFAEALLEYTKKNVVAAGRRWTREIESAARSIIPNRWRDVQRVLAEAQG